MEETITTNPTKKRPGFLTALCVLSYIGSGGSALYYLYNHFTFPAGYDDKVEKLQDVLDQLPEQSGILYNSTKAGLDKMEIMLENLSAITASNLLFAILSVIGITLMFKLKKNGFYLYSLANMFWLVVPLYFFGFGSTNLMGVGLGLLFTILFIILYGVNLKHME